MKKVQASELVAGQKFTAEYGGEKREVAVHAIFRDGVIGVLDLGVEDTGQDYETYDLNEEGLTLSDANGDFVDPGADALDALLAMDKVALEWEACSISGTVVRVDANTLVYTDEAGDECEVAVSTLSDIEVDEGGDEEEGDDDGAAGTTEGGGGTN